LRVFQKGTFMNTPKQVARNPMARLGLVPPIVTLRPRFLMRPTEGFGPTGQTT
jgi:hypothetical protein